MKMTTLLRWQKRFAQLLFSVTNNTTLWCSPVAQNWVTNIFSLTSGDDEEDDEEEYEGDADDMEPVDDEETEEDFDHDEL